MAIFVTRGGQANNIEHSFMRQESDVNASPAIDVSCKYTLSQQVLHCRRWLRCFSLQRGGRCASSPPRLRPVLGGGGVRFPGDSDPGQAEGGGRRGVASEQAPQASQVRARARRQRAHEGGAARGGRSHAIGHHAHAHHHGRDSRADWRPGLPGRTHQAIVAGRAAMVLASSRLMAELIHSPGISVALGPLCLLWVAACFFLFLSPSVSLSPCLYKKSIRIFYPALPKAYEIRHCSGPLWPVVRSRLSADLWAETSSHFFVPDVSIIVFSQKTADVWRETYSLFCHTSQKAGVWCETS